MTTTLSSKGQVVIPAEIRKKLALAEGSLISCQLIDGKIILDPQSALSTATLTKQDGRPVLLAPENAPKMTPELVNEILHT